MTVLEDSVRVGTRLSGLVDIACAVHRPDIPAMLVEWLGGRPDGHCIVDCTDDFQVVYTNQAAGTWARQDRLTASGVGGLQEVVARVWISGEPAQLRSFPIGTPAGRVFDIEVEPLGERGGLRPYVIISTREASLPVNAPPAVPPGAPPVLRLHREPGVRERERKGKGLSQRERQVAELVALGLTNSDIAGRLFLSRATIASHVAAILTKLRLRSRAQVAVWVVEQRQQRAAV